MNGYVAGILLFLVGVILAVCTLKGFAANRRAAWIAAAFFMLLGAAVCVIIYLEAYRWYYVVVGLPFFGFMALMGGSMIKDCLLCSGKTQGTYLRAQRMLKRRGSTYYSLVFSYKVGTAHYSESTEDTYALAKIEKHHTPRTACPIYYNPRNPRQIRLKRFNGLISGLLALLTGVIAVFSVIRLALA